MPAESIRFGPYLLQRRIARGGMAEVFLAQQRGPDGVERRVAVKRILPHHADTPDFIRMFLGEARLAAQLNHPNIVQIHDFGNVDADPFIAMEYVDGVHAGQVIRHGGADRLPPAMVARIGADAAAALRYAHELRAPGGQPIGLVHRDVSPANLMLSFDGAVKLCDFGIAKAVALGDRQLTRPGLVKGKYAYMSPEQTTGVPLDGRSDVYSLAIVLWELLAGRTLVPRGDAVAAMHAIRQGRLMPITRAAPWAPAPLAYAITWALATDRERRPDAAQLAQALEAFLVASAEGDVSAQLGGWLRARFPGDAAEPPSGETDATPSTTSVPFALAVVDAAGPAAAGTAADARAPVKREPRDAGHAPASISPRSVSSVDTTSRSFPALRDSHDAAAAPTLIATDHAELAGHPDGPPAVAPGDPDAEPSGERPIFAASGSSSRPHRRPRPQSQAPLDAALAAGLDAPRATSHAPIDAADASPPGPADHADTLLRSGAHHGDVRIRHGAAAVASPPGPATMVDNAETLLRSGAFRVPLPSGPSVVPTLLESRPAGLQGSPIHGMASLPAAPGPIDPSQLAAQRAARIGLIIAGMAGLAVLSFAIALGVRGARPSAAPLGATAGSAPAAAAPPVLPPPAPVPAPEPADSAASAPPRPPIATTFPETERTPRPPVTATFPETERAAPPPAPPAGPAPPSTGPPPRWPALAAPAATATLDVHTSPRGATVAVRRCRRGERKCTPAGSPVASCPAAPCTFRLPPGNYLLSVATDGAKAVRDVALMDDVSTSLDIQLKPRGRGRRP